MGSNISVDDINQSSTACISKGVFVNMTTVKTILLIVIILSLIVVAIFMPFGIIAFFLGEERAKKFYNRFDFSISYKKADVISVICMFLALIAYIIRDQL